MKSIKNFRDCFRYFIYKYKCLTGEYYSYHRGKYGKELAKIKNLKLTPEVFVSFINWLYNKKKLNSLNFLLSQLNDYRSSKEYKNLKEINNVELHNEIMILKNKIVKTCEVCGGVGYFTNGKKCQCMKDFLLERNKLRGIK